MELFIDFCMLGVLCFAFGCPVWLVRL